jgi:hypothetical protein
MDPNNRPNVHIQRFDSSKWVEDKSSEEGMPVNEEECR